MCRGLEKEIIPAQEQVNLAIKDKCYVFLKDKILMTYSSWIVALLLILNRLSMEYITYLIVYLSPLFYSIFL